MTVPDPDNASESSDGEVDPFEELGVQANLSNASVSDGLEAFMEDEEDDDTEETTEPIIESEEDDDDDDDDVFATLGVAGPAVALTSSGEDDILAAFMDDEEGEQEEEQESPKAEDPTSETPVQPEAKEAYRMVLETVWVDGVLDPGEVNLLARKREDLGISFEEHLTIVRDMLG